MIGMGARRRGGTEGIDDGLEAHQDAGELPDGFADESGEDASGALEGIEDGGEEGIDAGSLLADALECHIGGGLDLSGLCAEAVGHIGDVADGGVDFGSDTGDESADVFDDGHDGRADVIDLLFERAGGAADGKVEGKEDDALQEDGEAGKGGDDEQESFAVEFRHKCLSDAQGAGSG